MNDNDAPTYTEIANAARAWAKGLKPGDVFRGSHGEAEHRGYSRGTLEYVIFGTVAHNNLPGIIRVERDSIIVHVGD